MFLNAKRPPTIVRKVVTRVKKETVVTKEGSQSQRGAQSSSSTLKPQDALKRRLNGAAANHQRPHPTSRNSSPASANGVTRRQSRPQNLKRKASSPAAPRFDSDSDSEDDQAALDFISKKRIRSASPQQYDPDRVAFRVKEWSIEDKQSIACVHSATIVSGKYAEEYDVYKFDDSNEVRTTKLRFPSGALPEKYALVEAKTAGDYMPIWELRDTMNIICQHYMPKDQAAVLTNDNTGAIRRFIRATLNKDFQLLDKTVKEFNAVLKTAIADGSVARALKESKGMTHSLATHIIEMVYNRTVSPEVHALKAYKNGTSNVYGELLPALSSRIFKQTGLKSDHVFVDLGSGVGNVVLQAALEFGCESWGVEQMPNPARLATLQKKEFEARCKSFSVTPGTVHLLEGDFLQNPKIDDAIRRADVILINNQAFTPQLNDKILMKLLDVKEGGRIVSLKSFVPNGWEIKKRSLEDPRNLLSVVKHNYWSGSVSWTDGGGDYYVATIDSSRLRAFRGDRD